MDNTVQHKQASTVLAEAFGVKRVAAAVAFQPSTDLWSKSARDMLKVAALAGFDIKALMLDIYKRDRGGQYSKFNEASVLNAMDRAFNDNDNLGQADAPNDKSSAKQHERG